ncbi:hypothetical protein [Roseateles depolymerans]|uniref:Uncharacterized protein n=1 Tax=Roseateles depolymerans TaxID=76731 RepID=A0A0U3MTE2_9BURK|nr:hypothetical protein [Roseateles depolymerans]ALV07610.1 hypothetical protein RD2015_3150 [Roseateles depolymerans]REG22167.1 hypothetical protein DES44_1311 [Roseateles depolymerans]
MHTAFQEFAANPFAMLLDPEGVAQEVARSERLQRLRSQVYRPLDKPLIAHRGAADLASFDEEIDGAELSDADLLPLDGDDANLGLAA